MGFGSSAQFIVLAPPQSQASNSLPFLGGTVRWVASSIGPVLMGADLSPNLPLQMLARLCAALFAGRGDAVDLDRSGRALIGSLDQCEREIPVFGVVRGTFREYRSLRPRNLFIPG